MANDAIKEAIRLGDREAFLLHLDSDDDLDVKLHIERQIDEHGLAHEFVQDYTDIGSAKLHMKNARLARPGVKYRMVLVFED